jgi:thiol:disulfide interchange protein DsbD
VHAAVQVRLPTGYHVNSDRPLDPTLIPTVLSFQPPDGIRVREVAYPSATLLKQRDVENPLAVFEERFDIGVAFELVDTLATATHLVPAKLRYQACDATMCYLPSSREISIALKVVPSSQALSRQHESAFRTLTFGKGGSTATPVSPSAAAGSPANNRADALTLLDGFTVLGTTGGYLNRTEFLDFLRDANSGRPREGFFEGRGPLAILALILLGGLALNLTPCVLPMIPINLAIIGAGVQAGSRARGFLLGGAYGVAMAVVYGVLGLVVILTAGTFGVINSSPWFNLTIALLFVVLALAMFDVLLIDFSRFQSRFTFASSSRGSFLLAFSMGAVAALLAGACVAPVVIQVIVFASNLYASGTRSALLLPFFLGVGMALPWPIAGAGLARLPRPGAWMVRVKQAFGVFILATAAYYGYAAYEIFASRWVDTAAVERSVGEKIKEGWYPSLPAGLTAAKAENKLVLIDMWATWCKNCLTMDKTTLRDPAVITALADYVKVKFQAEDPSTSPAAEVMERFNAVGLPTYVVLRPR